MLSLTEFTPQFLYSISGIADIQQFSATLAEVAVLGQSMVAVSRAVAILTQLAKDRRVRAFVVASFPSFGYLEHLATKIASTDNESFVIKVRISSSELAASHFSCVMLLAVIPVAQSFRGVVCAKCGTQRNAAHQFAHHRHVRPSSSPFHVLRSLLALATGDLTRCIMLH
jgi:hypothetical protein